MPKTTPGHPGPVVVGARDQVPRSADHEAQVQWLYSWWERTDAWITENRPGGVAVPAVAQGSG